MPNGDGTGPWWAHGRIGCRKSGRYMCSGVGFGRNMSQPSKEQELQDLEAYALDLTAELKKVESLKANIKKK